MFFSKLEKAILICKILSIINKRRLMYANRTFFVRQKH